MNESRIDTTTNYKYLGAHLDPTLQEDWIYYDKSKLRLVGRRHVGDMQISIVEQQSQRIILQYSKCLKCKLRLPKIKYSFLEKKASYYYFVFT